MMELCFPMIEPSFLGPNAIGSFHFPVRVYSFPGRKRRDDPVCHKCKSLSRLCCRQELDNDCDQTISTSLGVCMSVVRSWLETHGEVGEGKE